MTSFLLIYLFYALAKIMGYTFYMYVGLRYFRTSSPSHIVLKSIGLGLLRVLLGIAAGYLVLMTSSRLVPSQNSMFANVGFLHKKAFLASFAIYTPIRFLEWAAFVPLALRGVPLKRCLLWIGGGIVLSFAIDIAFSFAGIPMPRMC